eukprot:TRINITY_DN242_c0_g1_i10.p1 TRINITY_DN242_c0_g1~~TRINITY_DN242_c0_g1_i10.p1  ORF type:complete len:291 (-),score=61.19 TRINITY_DN242_c0_g1_i10:702-1574(-)
MIRRPPRSTLSSSSAASDVYKRQYQRRVRGPSRNTRCVREVSPEGPQRHSSRPTEAMNNATADKVDAKAKHFAQQRRAQQKTKYEFENNIEHGFPDKKRDAEIEKHAKRLEKKCQYEPQSALRIARKQHGMSTVKPKEDTFNRLLVIKDSALERATYGNPWQKHGIRPAPKENKRRAIDTAKTYADKQRQQRKEMCRRRRLKKPQSGTACWVGQGMTSGLVAINMMEKQESSASKQDSSDDEQFPEKPDMHIFSLVDDNSDDDLGGAPSWQEGSVRVEGKQPSFYVYLDV